MAHMRINEPWLHVSEFSVLEPQLLGPCILWLVIATPHWPSIRYTTIIAGGMVCELVQISMMNSRTPDLSTPKPSRHPLPRPFRCLQRHADRGAVRQDSDSLRAPAALAVPWPPLKKFWHRFYTEVSLCRRLWGLAVEQLEVFWGVLLAIFADCSGPGVKAWSRGPQKSGQLPKNGLFLHELRKSVVRRQVDQECHWRAQGMKIKRSSRGTQPYTLFEAF